MSNTHLVITVAVITLGIYDLIVVFRRGVGSSISRALQVAGFRSPTVVFVFGYLAGHFWGYMPPEPLSCPCVTGHAVATCCCEAQCPTDGKPTPVDQLPKVGE